MIWKNLERLLLSIAIEAIKFITPLVAKSLRGSILSIVIIPIISFLLNLIEKLLEKYKTFSEIDLDAKTALQEYKNSCEELKIAQNQFLQNNITKEEYEKALQSFKDNAVKLSRIKLHKNTD